MASVDAGAADSSASVQPQSALGDEEVVGRPPHHERVAERDPLEVGEVLGDAPRDAATIPDHAVARVRRDQGDGTPLGRTGLRRQWGP